MMIMESAFCPLIKSKIITYAIDGPADVRAQNITYHLSGSHFEIVFPRGNDKNPYPVYRET